MPSNVDSLRLHLRLAARDFVWLATNRHRQGTKPNIGIFGSRRSGSTLLMQGLAANPRVKSIDQPVSVYSGSAYQVRKIPIRDCGQIFYLDDQEERILSEFIENITVGRIHVAEPWEFWRKNFSWRTDRLVFKMTNTHNLTEWFKSRFGWHVVALMRHPLSQSLSVMNLNAAVGGWDSRAPGFFRSQEYCEEHLDDEQVALAHDVWKGGNELDRQVLGWGLENLPLVRGLPRYRHWSFVSYEAMVLDADALLHALAESFDLPDAARMVAVIGQASRSVRGLSVAERQAAIRRRDTQALLGSWRRRIDIADETRAFGILERLGLDLYRAGSDVPSQLWYTPTTRATEAVAPVGTDSIVQ